jgi:hypothetical protein
MILIVRSGLAVEFCQSITELGYKLRENVPTEIKEAGIQESSGFAFFL